MPEERPLILTGPPARAGGTPRKTMPTEDAMKMRRGFAATTGLIFLGATMASAQAAKPAGDMTGHHSMEGQVTKVDAKKGWVDVKTSEGSMKLHFPPEALANIKKGDSVTVELGIKDNGPAPSGSVKSKTQ
jgi:hypothetical protein